MLVVHVKALLIATRPRRLAMSSTEPSPRKSKRIQWDEPNLKSNEEYAAANPKTKIDEPKTPFHCGSGPESLGSPAQQPIGGAPSAQQPESAGEYHEHRLEAGMHDPAALSATALERRDRDANEEVEDEYGNLGALLLVHRPAALLLACFTAACPQFLTCSYPALIAQGSGPRSRTTISSKSIAAPIITRAGSPRCARRPLTMRRRRSRRRRRRQQRQAQRQRSRRVGRRLRKSRRSRPDSL